MPLIFQYGSNTDAEHFKGRLGDIEDRGRAETVDEYDLRFDVWSHKNGCAASDLLPAPGTGRHAWGVLYEISEVGLQKLRKIEGNRYEERSIRVVNEAGEKVEARTFSSNARNAGKDSGPATNTSAIS